ncbi:putative toxin [Mycobacteroides abscessus]|uniref:putative toxin n=1 Tax=Mycobacteroides abscessus TaxID=36809 RepID=UPI0005DE2429|nr:putative toxin [Mycobacteroides abscessus]CPW66924.1 Hypothetical protein ERS075590_03333 [Mycobacteroides abscessus]SKF61959.1 Uncharacterised protein [Mycobacteroides abscessus subsp. bolletii]SKH89416.1 Uncharacterised protein [Mycobacteroides abscessus subsp. bolletii]
MSGNGRSTERLTAVTDCRDLTRSGAVTQELPARDLEPVRQGADDSARRLAAFAAGAALLVVGVAELHNLYRAGDGMGELVKWSGPLLLWISCLGGGIKLAMWSGGPATAAVFDAAKARLTEFGRAVVAAAGVIIGALGMWWTFRGGYTSWWQHLTGESQWSLLLGVSQMLVAVLAGAALFTGGRYVTGLAKEALTDSGLLIERDRAAGRRRAPEGLWHPGLVAALIGGGLGLVLLTAGITPRLYVWITGPEVLPAVAAIAVVLLWAIGSNLGWWKGLVGLWKWATDASQKAGATAGVIAVLMFSAGGLGLGWFTPATVPQARAACPPDCGGGGGSDMPPGGGQMFQPPSQGGQQMPDYSGGNYGRPGLDQNSGISIYNENPAGQQVPSQTGGRQSMQEPPFQANPDGSWQARNGEWSPPNYQTATPFTQGPGRPNPDWPGNQGAQPNPGAQSGNQSAQQPPQPAQQQVPQQQPSQQNPGQQPNQQPQQSDSQRIDDLTRQLQDQQQQGTQDRQRIDDLTKQLQQQNKQSQKQQQSPRFPSKDDKKDRDQQDRDNQSGDNDLSALLLGAASTRRRKQDDPSQPDQQQQQGPDTQALAQDGAQLGQSLPGDIANTVSDGVNLGQSAGSAAQNFGSAAQAGASLASSAQSGAVNPMDAVAVVQGVSGGISDTADAVGSGASIASTWINNAGQGAQLAADANPQLKPQAEQVQQLTQAGGQVADLTGKVASGVSQASGVVNSVSSMGSGGLPTDAAGEPPAEMVGWATSASGPAGTGPATFVGPPPELPAPADPAGGEAPIEDQLVPLIAGRPVKIDQAVKFRTASGAPSPDLFAFGTGTFLPVADTESGPAILTWGYQGMGPTKVVNQTTELWVNGEQAQPEMLMQNNLYTLTIPAISDGDTFVFKQHLTLQWQEAGVTREATGTLDGWLQPQNSPGTNAELGGISSGAKGRQGMAAVGLQQNTTPIYPDPSAKKYRVPDIKLDKPIGILGEVKNVKYQGLTAQLNEYMKYAKANGYVFHLFVRQGEGTQLSQALQNEITAGNIVLHRVI